MKTGKWIVINGTDGSGKTKQEELLLQKNPDWKTVREPGGTVLGEIIREMLLSDAQQAELLRGMNDLYPFVCNDQEAKMLWDSAKQEVWKQGMSGQAEVYLYALSRLWSTRQIQKWLSEGYTVISTRSVACSFAYQAYGRELGEELVAKSNRVSMELLQPDAELFLHVSPEVAEKRKSGRGEKDRFDRETAAFFQKVSKGYDAYYEQHAKHLSYRISAEGTIEEVAKNIEEILRTLG